MEKRKWNGDGDNDSGRNKHVKPSHDETSETRDEVEHGETDAQDGRLQEQRRQDEQPESKRASLCGLPAELRLYIWECVLYNPDDPYDSDDYDPSDVLITQSNSLQPGILRTSRQLRKEAYPIWFAEENARAFVVEIKELKLLPQLNHWLWHVMIDNREGSNIRVELPARRNSGQAWLNLIEWLKLYHAGTTQARPPYQIWRGDHLARRVIHAMFAMTETLENMAWGVVEKALEDWGGVFVLALQSPT